MDTTTVIWIKAIQHSQDSSMLIVAIALITMTIACGIACYYTGHYKRNI